MVEEEPRVVEEPKKRTGRPVGAKDSKPRRKKVEASPEVPSVPSAPPRDPVFDYHEAKRAAVEQAYRAQGDHWANLLSHLM